MRINNNISAVNTLNSLQASDGAMSKSLERLSSGLRITRAADDAAGLAISEKMRNQVKGLNQARRNSQDGISLIQTAEGALNESHSILGRMRELTVQASNDTLTNDDRNEIQKEMNNLTDEIDRISTDTEFNTKKLLNGDASATAKQAASSNTSGAAVSSAKATSVAEVGTYKLKFNNSQAAQAMETVTRTSSLEGQYKINSGGISGAAAADLNSSLTATTGTNFFGGAAADATNNVSAGTFFINDKTITIESGDTMNKLLKKINDSGAGVAATVDATNTIRLYADKDVATNIKIEKGTSDFTEKANFASGTNGWQATNVAAVDDDQLLTGATAGTVRLTNLQQESTTDPTSGDLALQTTDVIKIAGKVNGQEKTSNFTVGTSTVKDLLTNIENTFGGATATMELQRASATATGAKANDFNENLTLHDAFGGMNVDDVGALKINGVTIQNSTTGKDFDGNTDTLQTFVNSVNAKTSETGVSAALDRDNKQLVFSSANNVRMDITSADGTSSGAIAGAIGISNADGTTRADGDNKVVIRGLTGSDNAITDVAITATNNQGNAQRSVFNSSMAFTQMQVARDKGDFAGVAQLNSDPTDLVKQSAAVAVKLESTNTKLINGVNIEIGSKISTADNARDTSTISVGNTDGSVKLQIGANKAQMTTVSIGDMGSVALGIKDAKTGARLSVMTREDAQNTLTKVDNAISKVSAERSKLGAIQNRLEHTITNLGVSSENMTASESRVRDLDMAQEMSQFTRNQILMQAGTAMMGQANQKTQGVMRLLG